MLLEAYTVVSVEELLERMRGRKSVRGLVALTFDDAYESVWLGASTHALIGRVPKMLMMVSRAATTGSPFWWDRIDDVLAPRSPVEIAALLVELGARPPTASANPRSSAP